MRPGTVWIQPKRDDIDAAAILDDRPALAMAHSGSPRPAVHRYKFNDLRDSCSRDSVRRLEHFNPQSNQMFERATTANLKNALRAASVDSVLRLRVRINALPGDTCSLRAVAWEQLRPGLEQAGAPVRANCQ